MREALGDKAPPKLVPKTIDAMREHDETTVQAPKEEGEAAEDEVTWDIDNDEFKDYFGKTYVPKVLITSADNPRTVRELLNLLGRGEMKIYCCWLGLLK